MPAQTRARGDEALQARRAAAQGGTPEPEKTPEGSYATRPGGQRRHTAAGRGSAARSKAAPISKTQSKIATNFAKLNIENSIGTSQFFAGKLLFLAEIEVKFCRNFANVLQNIQTQ